ncbi:MAG: 50S ribosomal protein L25 [Kiritimatiellae bacterium]|nr:50S ribosomal protein L25 [Kiritimatiellia bacterium]MDD4735457.1 50S ribosomal protein L25 [Kiritimatiellia bacterium]
MAGKEIKVVAMSRKEQGTGAVRRMRHTGEVPAVVYGEEHKERLIKLNEHVFGQLMRHHASEHLVLDLEIDGATVKALMKEVQHHPVTGRVLHVDFQEISLKKKIRVEVPIELVGDPIGVTQDGGVLEHLIRNVEVECLPMDVMESIEVDVSEMAINTRMTVSAIKLDPEKFTILTSGDVAFAAVMPPRLQAETAAEEGEEASAEGVAATAEKAGGDKAAEKAAK